jgi:hypothetical protein
MLEHLDNIPYIVLVPAAVLLLLAPLAPEPHVIEKLRMLKAGTLKRPIDIFDLCFHLLPTVLLCVKGVRDILK